MTARIPPLPATDPRSADPQLEELVSFLGYRPNALLTMARKPGLLGAVLGLVQAALRGQGDLPIDLRFLLACEASRGARCFYSATHAVHAAHSLGVSWEKLDALDHYAASDLYTPAERAALAIASAGATLPVGEAGAPFERAAAHFSESQRLDIVAAVALFGWFNRWNSLMQSELEHEPGAEALERVRWLRPLRDGA
jgi:alkylhydroperoxidase family enzyme